MCKPVGLCKLKCNYLLAIEVKITPVVLFFAQIVSSPMQLCLKDVRYPPDMNAMAHFLKCRNLKLRAPITYSLHITVNPPALPLSVFLMDGVHHFEVDEQAILKIQVIALQEQLKNKTTDYQALQKRVDILTSDVKQKQHIIETLNYDLYEKESQLMTVKGIALSLHEKAKLYNNEVDRLSRKIQEVVGLDIPSTLVVQEDTQDEDIETCTDALLPRGIF